MTETVNGHHADTIPVQVKPLGFDPVTPPAPGATKDAVPDQAAQSAAELVVDEQQHDQDQADETSQPRGFIHRARTVAGHKHTRAVFRQAYYVGSGAAVAHSRRRDAKSTTRHQRMMRAAEAAGDHEKALEWAAKEHQHKAEKHRRRMELIKHAPHVAGAVLTGGIVSGIALLLLGACMAAHDHQASEVLRPLQDVESLIAWCGQFLAAIWWPAVIATPFALAAAAWNTGRRHAEVPQALAPAVPADPDARGPVPDEGAILEALRNLGLAPLNKAFKAGWRPRWTMPTHLSGNGYQTQLQLPQGVTVEMVNGKRSVLAHNLLRIPIEVWPTEPDGKPGVLDLWVAHSGSLTAKVPPYPLIEEDTPVDYFDRRGVPVALSQRGDIVYAPLMAKNYMVGGIMGTGKSSFTRNLLCGAMQDPLVDIGVFVMAFNADYDLMRPRLSTLVKGDDDEQIEAALNELRRLRDDVSERGKLLEKYGETAVTRKLAQKDSRLRPKIRVFDEVHELFEHPVHGEEAADLAIKVLKKARKCAITLVFVTVSPTATSIPKDVTRNTSNRVAFAVGDHVANDGLLGTGKHKSGITATTLNPAKDIGTALTVGFSANPFELVRMYFVNASDGNDEVTPLVKRAMAALEKAGLPVGGTAQADAPAGRPDLDVLADVADLLGGLPRMRVQEVMQRLAEQDSRYRDWTNADFKAAMEKAGAPTYPYNGVKHVNGDSIREAMARRFSATETE